MPGTFSAIRNHTGTAVLRVVVGTVFVLHGWRKIMVGASAVSDAFAKTGIPAPLAAAILVTVIELLCGLLLVLGLKTRLAVIPLGVTMIIATWLHATSGFFLPEGYEYTLVLLSALVTLGLGGPGAASLDRFLGKGVKNSGTLEDSGVKQDATGQTIEPEGPESA